MGTNYIAPTWRQPENTNKDKLSNYGIDTTSTSGIDCGPMADIFGTSSVTYNTSYSIWIKPEFNYNDAGYQTFFGNFSTGNNALLLYYATDIDAWKFAVGDGNGHNYVSSATITSNEELGKGEWQHHCVVFDTINNDAYYYINNQLVNDGTGGSTGTNLTRKIATNANFYIGKKWDLAAGTFTGQISQGCIFDYALSTEQRTYLYNLNNPIAISGAKPIAYWPLGDNSNPTATAGYPNISVGADSVFDFERSNSEYIDLNPGVMKDFTSDNVSISAWVKANTLNAYDYIFVDGATSNNRIVSLNYASVRGGLEFTVGNSSVARASGVSISTGKWYHIVCTYAAGGDLKFYLNGNTTPVATAAFSGALDLSSHTKSSIGGSAVHSANYWDGEISNVQIWNAELGTSDVTTLYNNGQPLMTGTQPEEANLRAWYKLNQSANWEADSALNWQIPDAVSEYPQSFNFDNNPYILFSPNFYTVGSNKMQVSTVSWWMNSNRAGSYSVIFAFDSNNSWMLRIDNSGNMWFFSGSGASYVKFNNVTGNSINLCDSKWHHCVFTIPDATDKTQCKFFIDNQEITSTITSGSAGGDGSLVMQQLELAGGYLGNIEGTVVSNVQAWLDIALDSSDVETLYNNGVPLPTNSVQSDKLKGWWKLDNNDVWNPVLNQWEIIDYAN